MDNQEMIKKLQKSLAINRFCNLLVAVLMLCLLVGGYILYQKITPVITAVQDIRTSLKYVEQIDYQALNQAISDLDMEELNAKIEALDVDNLNKALEGLDTEELTEAMENLNNAVDRLEALGESVSSLGEWFGNNVKF